MACPFLNRWSGRTLAAAACCRKVRFRAAAMVHPVQDGSMRRLCDGALQVPPPHGPSSSRFEGGGARVPEAAPNFACTGYPQRWRIGTEVLTKSGPPHG